MWSHSNPDVTNLDLTEVETRIVAIRDWERCGGLHCDLDMNYTSKAYAWKAWPQCSSVQN